MNQELNWENLAKRLLAMMTNGFYLTGDDGHIWIEEVEDDYRRYALEKLHHNKIMVRSKVYGGVLEALNRIDYALSLVGLEPLLNLYDEDVMFLGPDTFSESDVSKEGT